MALADAEVDVIAASLRDHQRSSTTDGRCECGRNVVTQEEHQAEELIEALRLDGMGVFLFENLPALLEEDL